MMNRSLAYNANFPRDVEQSWEASNKFERSKQVCERVQTETSETGKIHPNRASGTETSPLSSSATYLAEAVRRNFCSRRLRSSVRQWISHGEIEMLETESALVKTPWKEFEFLPSNSFPVRMENETIAFIGGERLNSSVSNEFVFNFSMSEAFEIIRKSQRTKVLFPEAEIVLIVVYAILVSSGIVSNLLVCFVVTRQCLRKRTTLGSTAPKSRNLYVANLALADLVLCSICMPFTLVTLIQYEWTFGSLLCKLVPVIQGTNIMVSAGTITAIAFDRYITIVRPPGSRVLYSHSRCKVLVVILIIWIVSFAIASPVYFYTVIEPVTFYDILLYEKCIERWPSNGLYTSFTVGFALVQFVIPGLVLVTIHMKISAYLKLHLKPIEENQPKIEVHSPAEERLGPEVDDNGKDDSSRKEFLSVRKESVASEDSQRSCETPRKSSLVSRKLSDGSRKESTNWCVGRGSSSEASPRKRSDFLVTFRDGSDFSFHNFGDKTKSVKSRKRVRRELRRNRRTMFMLSCIAVAYAVSWLPMTIYQVLITQIPRIHQSPKTVYVAFAVCHIFAMSTTITNPLLYGWLNPNFRREFYVIFSSVSSFFSKLVQINRSDSIPVRNVPKPGHTLAYIDGKVNAPTVALVANPPRMQL